MLRVREHVPPGRPLKSPLKMCCSEKPGWEGTCLCRSSGTGIETGSAEKRAAQGLMRLETARGRNNSAGSAVGSPWHPALCLQPLLGRGQLFLNRTGFRAPRAVGLSWEEAPGGRRAPAGSRVWDAAALTSQDMGSSELHTRPCGRETPRPTEPKSGRRLHGLGSAGAHAGFCLFLESSHPIPGTAHFLEEAQSHGLACVCLCVNTYRQAGLKTDLQTSENPSSRLVSSCSPG